MNIFFLEHNPELCAKYHNDKHCVKMILETAQILSTAHRVLDGQELVIYDSRQELLYKATHINHPCSVWVRQSSQNYSWAYNLFVELLNEYTYRYGKTHKSSELMRMLEYIPVRPADGEFTEPAQAMPDDVKVPGNSVIAYRKYYRKYKNHLAQWKNREIPFWFTGEEIANISV